MLILHSFIFQNCVPPEIFGRSDVTLGFRGFEKSPCGILNKWHWWHLLYLFVDVFYFLILIFWISWILWVGCCCCFYFPILMLNILRRWNWGTGWMVSDSDDTADHSNDPASPHCAAQTSTFLDFPFSYFAFYFFLYFLSKF